MKKIQQEDDLRGNIRANLPYSEKYFNEFIHIDDQIVTVEYLDDDAVVAAMCSAVDTDDDEEKENKDEESVGMELIPTPTTSGVLRHFLLSRNTPQRVLDRLAEVECAQKIVTQLELPLLKQKGHRYEKLPQEDEDEDLQATEIIVQKEKVRWWSDKKRDRTKSEERIDNKKNEIVEKQLELKEKLLAKSDKPKEKHLQATQEDCL
ncbi:unnamed protein product [Acanthoscelides obtectus]|uniref:Uncharacterized protein n=1 Tax=Acanthoscelides obtectus TaxID=200917 RepID=A0A9P0KDJ4_ACAOB|nr:unnamed protein product [Acanthoscelides obtectus]CAK1635524.1 hypothetical protein AOBTE_LOCUS9334 [Acanthoscelides obtectus]